MHLNRRLLTSLHALLAILAATAVARADDSDLDHPPFDFSNAFYIANGIDPTTLIGRPNGTPPGSVIDNFENGPNFNNVRILELTAAFSDSGKPIFFYVTGLPTPASFLPNAAGAKALENAEKYRVFEFPRATNPPLGVFPKRQDLIADLSNGYFSNDPLGVWQVNLVRFTPAAFSTPAGQQKLATLAAKNGFDLDGTPVIKTKSEVFDLQSNGFVTITVPPVGVGRWFFCPVLKDPRGGEIAPDAHLTVVELPNGMPLPAEQEHFNLFHCLQSTGDECESEDAGSVTPRAGVPANPSAFSALLPPILGVAFETRIDHTTFAPTATNDLLLLGATAVNLPSGIPGTLLVAPLGIFVGTAGEPFALPVPLATSLLGTHFTTQGASALNGALKLTNALDAQIGTH